MIVSTCRNKVNSFEFIHDFHDDLVVLLLSFLYRCETINLIATRKAGIFFRTKLHNSCHAHTREDERGINIKSHRHLEADCLGYDCVLVNLIIQS